MERFGKIGIACNSFLVDGGMGRYVQDLTAGLVALGVRPVIFAKKVDRSLALAQEVELVTVDCRWVPGKLRDQYFSWRVGALRRAYGIDTLIATTRNRHSDIAVCGGTHKGFCRAMERPDRWSDRRMTELETDFYRKSALVVAHSKGMQRDLVTLYGLPADKCPVIYPPVPPELLREPEPLKQPVFERAPGKYYFVIPSAGEHRVKGIDYLVDYFDRTEQPVELLIAGRGLKIPLGKNVRHIGFRSDMPDVYRSVDFTILGSRYEAFGLVGIESVLCGTPVLFSQNVCSSEVISDEAKLVFDVRSRDAFEEAVRTAIERFGHRKLEAPLRFVDVETDPAKHARAVLDAYAARRAG